METVVLDTFNPVHLILISWFRPMSIFSLIASKISRLLIGCRVSANDTLIGSIFLHISGYQIKIKLI